MSKVSSDVLKEGIAGEYVQPATWQEVTAAATALEAFRRQGMAQAAGAV